MRPMARRKTDAERGPLGAWAYNTRDALDLSVEAVIGTLPTTYHPATLRKVEGGTVPPGRRMWREIGNLYGKVADERRVAIDPQPRLASESGTVGGPIDLVAALNRNSNVIEALVIMLARREGITLHDLAEAETSIVDQLVAVAGQASANEAMQPGQNPAPGGPRLPARTPRELQSAKR